MEYLLADPVAVPTEDADRYVEQIIHLPSFLCYAPPAYAPAVTPPPSRERGYVTFGAFNRLPKVSAEAVATWARVLAAAPGSRLVVKCTGADVSPGREWLSDGLAAHGVRPERVTLLGSTPHPDHLAAFGQIDVMLDTFPQSGGITTLDALLMGVPVVTLLGRRITGRASASLLTTLGLDDLVAATTDEYVEVAAQLAADPARIARERATLRARLLASPIADAALYTRAVEAAYRAMWQRWTIGQESRR
jgi:predicted O-linked N-acetylglucosamine transferase (SPINDLY family)